MSFAEKLKEIDKLRSRLDELAPLNFLDKNNKLWKKFRLEWNYNSNHIEGNTLTYGETELLLIFEKTTGDHDKREYDEMQAHDVAIQMINEWVKNKERDITESDIRELNRIILVKPFWKEAITSDGQPTKRLISIGEYKKHPNSVRLKNGELFQYAPPEQTPQMMHDLMLWYRNNKIQNSIILAADLHYRFISIHPFDDGNGRIARLLVNYVLMRTGYPPVVIKSNEKEKYITALNKADTGDISAFREYMADQLIWSLELSIKAAKGEDIEEPDDLYKEISLWKKQLPSDDKEIVIKNASAIVNVYENGIDNLFNNYIKKIQSNFSDVFTSIHIHGWYNNGSANNEGKELIDKKINKLKKRAENDKDSLESIGTTQDDRCKQIRIDVLLKAFKHNGINIFDCNSFIEVEFREYTYKVKTSDNPIKEYKYNELIKNDDCIQIINSEIKSLMKRIESQRVAKRN